MGNRGTEKGGVLEKVQSWMNRVRRCEFISVRRIPTDPN